MKFKFAYIGDLHGQIDGDLITGLGGYARLVSAFANLQACNSELIILNGGDILGQTPYSTEFKGEADAEVLKKINTTAYAVGNHDFNFGTLQLARLIRLLGKLFLAANLDVTHDPYLKDLVQPYVIHETPGGKIAIIGLITEEIQKLGEQKTGKTKLITIEETLNAVLSELSKQDINKIIILSHLGYDPDVKLAQDFFKNKNISVVILGNHTHTTMGNTLEPADFGPSKGEYPTVVDLGNKHQALITNIPPHGQVIGLLDVEFNDEGYIVHYSKDTQLVVDQTIQPDSVAVKTIEKYQKELPAWLTKVYARTEIAYCGLEGQPPYAKPIEDFIRQTESPIANFAADAFYWQAQHLNNYVDFALIHAGGIRADWGKGEITGRHINQLHPFGQHNVIVLELTGAEIKQALEESVYNENFHRRGEFLIGSAQFQYAYKIEGKERGERISKMLLHGKEIEANKTYRVAINGFMSRANTVNVEPCLFKKKLEHYRDSQQMEQFRSYVVTDRQAVMNYLENNPQARVLTGKLDGRVIYEGISLLDQYVPENVTVKPEDKYIVCMKELHYHALRASAIAKQTTSQVEQNIREEISKTQSQQPTYA